MPANAADVLVVEDNEFNMEVVTTMLQQLGHNVTMAWNGSECLEMLFDANGSPFRHPEGSPRAPESTREHPRAPESTRDHPRWLRSASSTCCGVAAASCAD